MSKMGNAVQNLARRVVAPVMAFLLIIAIISIAYSSLRDWSYGKLEPYQVVLQLSDIDISEPAIRMDIKFDYGYGYIAAHTRSLRLPAEPATQRIVISTSGWKPLQRIRVVSPEIDDFELQQWSLQRSGCDYAASATDTTAAQAEVVMESSLNECEVAHDS